MARLYAKLKVMRNYYLLLFSFVLSVALFFLSWPHLLGLCGEFGSICYYLDFYWRFAFFGSLFFIAGSLITTLFLEKKLPWLMFTAVFALLSSLLLFLNQDLPLGGTLFPPLYVILVLGFIYLLGTLGFVFFTKK